MGHQLKLKIALLASVAFLIVGFLCATSVEHAYGNSSGPAPLDSGSQGSAHPCSGSFSRSSFTMAAANAVDSYGRAKPGDGGGSFVWPPSQGLSIDAGLSSGGTLLSFAKVSLNILFCVHTL
jgi:hypothetical protein